MLDPIITLAQLGNPLGGAAPAALPDAPLLERVLLEQPWPLVALLSFGGIVAWALLARLTPARRLSLAAVGPLLALALWVIASLVHTGREQMRRSTLALIGAAARADTSAVAALLADDFAFYPPGGGPGLGRDRITSLVRTELGGAFKVDDWTAVELQASSDHRRPTDPERGQTQIHVRATIDGFLTFSWWKFDWERAPDGQWKLISAEPSDPSAGTWMGQRFGR